MATIKELSKEAKILYKKFYNKDAPNTEKANKLLNRIENYPITDIIYKSDGVKVLLGKFTIDYDYGEEDSIFLTKKESLGYRVGEYSINKFPAILETF